MPIKEFIEREYKGLISESDYLRVIEKHLPEVGRQINYYFDTPDCELYKQGITLRVRDKNAGAVATAERELTVKTSGVRTGNTSLRGEHTQKLKSDRPINGSMGFEELLFVCGAEVCTSIQNALIAIKINELKCFGSLVTERSKIGVGGNLFIELDKSEYLGCTDYEVEFEYNGERDLYGLQNFIKQNGITVWPSIGKYSRFIRKLKGM